MKKLAKFKKRIRRTETTNAHLESWLEQLDGWLEELQNEVGSIRQMTTEGVVGPKGPKGDQGEPGTLEGVAMLEELRQRVTRLETKQDIDHLNALRSIQSARAAVTRLAVATDEATQGGIKSFANRDRHAATQEKAQWIEYPWKLDVDKESGKIDAAVGPNFVNDLINRIHTAEIKHSGPDVADFLAYVDAVDSRKPKNPVATTADGILDPKNPPPAGHSFVEMTTDELHARKLAEEPAQSRSLDDVEKAAADELNEAQDKIDFFELLAKRQDKRVRVYGRSSTDSNQWAILVRSACTTLGRPYSWGFDLLETAEPFDGILARNAPVRK